MSEPPRFDDDPRPRDDEPFQAWLKKRKPEDDPPISPSAAFLDMMRQAAERRADNTPPEQSPTPDAPAPIRPPTPPARPLPDEARRVPDEIRFMPPPSDPTPVPEDDSAPTPTPFDPRAEQPDQPPDVPPTPRSRAPRRVERISARDTRDAAPLDPESDSDARASGTFALVDNETGEPVRRRKRPARASSMIGGFARSLFIIMAAAGLIATIFTWWTPPGFLPSSVRQDLALQAAAMPTATVFATAIPTPNWAVRVGIVSGHRGPQNDPGAVCPDGLTEREINFNTAQVVVRQLQSLGYTVDLLDEFDPRLQNYQAAALLSIHANTCREWPDGEIVSGYLIAAPAARVTARGNDELLVDCVSRAYAGASGLTRREGSTIDMTDYHNFREIHPLTPGAIIELGFMRADRELLLQPERMGQGLVQGLLCFLEPLRFQQPTPIPSPESPTPTTGG
jgi:N-acetylmuramoyl-L-alanine amidase